MTVETLTESAGCNWLRWAASRVDVGQAIVEVGVYRGGSLEFICEGAQAGNGAPVYGVDPWALEGAYPDRPNMLKRYVPADMNIAAETAPYATLIRDFSVSAAAQWDHEPVGLLYIDAVHRKPDVLEDFAAWRPLLAHDAVVAFDDHEPRFRGVIDAVAELASSGQIGPVAVVGNRLAVARAL